MKVTLIKLLSTFIKLPAKFYHIYSSLVWDIDKRLGSFLLDGNTAEVDKKITTFRHTTSSSGSISMSLFTPNTVCKSRADTFSTKEPETLEWIEEFGTDKSVLYDIGANIGIYSIYHCLLNQGKTIAFEPSFFNLKQLAKNISANNCDDDIIVVPNALSSHNQISTFKYGEATEGGALSAFGVDFGFDGQSISSQLSTKVIGLTLDSLFEYKLLDLPPDLVKIDVDGIEHIILEGAIKTLSNPSCKSILIEVNDDFKEQGEGVENIMNQCGFILRDKKHGKMFNKSELYSNTYNQIWVKKEK